VVRWNYPLFKVDGKADPTKLKKSGKAAEYSIDIAMKKLGLDHLSNEEWQKRIGCSRSKFYELKSELLSSGKVMHSDDLNVAIFTTAL
jgi:hypothetical protein